MDGYDVAVVGGGPVGTWLAATPVGFADRLDTVTAELAGDRPDWAGIRAMLIRPDGYIAWATSADDPPPLASWLGPASGPSIRADGK
jgi:hypothetical protein